MRLRILEINTVRNWFIPQVGFLMRKLEIYAKYPIAYIQFFAQCCTDCAVDQDRTRTRTFFSIRSTRFDAGLMCIGSHEEQQGQYTESVFATQCMMHWAQAIALQGSSIGCVRMSKHTGHSKLVQNRQIILC